MLLHHSFLLRQQQDSCPAAHVSPPRLLLPLYPPPHTNTHCCRSSGVFAGQISVSVVTSGTALCIRKQAKNDIHHPLHCCRRLVVPQLLKPTMQQGPLTTAAACETNCCNQAWAPACVSTQQQQQKQKKTVIIEQGALLGVCMLPQSFRVGPLLTNQQHLHTHRRSWRVRSTATPAPLPPSPPLPRQ